MIPPNHSKEIKMWNSRKLTGLGIIQREESIFTFEGWSLLGTEAIIEKLVVRVIHD
jgi:hypothetical protein